MGYYFIYPLLLLLSFLPLPVLYGIGGLISFILKNIIGYRKVVITENIRKSFPDKDDAWVSTTVSQYYSHLGNLMAEIIKLFSASPAFIQKRVTFRHFEIFSRYYEKGQSIIIVMGHTGNWEWASAAMKLSSSFNQMVVYKPIKSSMMDRTFLKLRSRFGITPVPMNSVYRKISSVKEVSATAFLADQSAPPEYSCWINFLNRPAPVFKGVEKIASKTSLPVVFVNVNKIRRGYYEIVVQEVPDNGTPCGLTENHTRLLEQAIMDNPVNWLWSHKRWKHKPPSDKV